MTWHGDAGTGKTLAEKGFLLLFLHSCPRSLAVFKALLSSLLVNSVSQQNISTIFLLGMRLAELVAMLSDYDYFLAEMKTTSNSEMLVLGGGTWARLWYAEL